MPALAPAVGAPAAPPAIVCEAVAKRFYHYEHRTTSLQELVGRALSRRPVHVRHASFEIRDLSLTIARGEAVALIGSNGSGKSTALRLMAGIYQPTTGTVVRHGRIVAVIELGATFHTELTGGENVEMYAAALGLSRSEIAARVPEMIAFSELGDFIGVPMKYYSSGMRARLAFSVAVCASPDTLLLDEVLAVGDERFRERCLARIREFHRRGGTLVVVTHELESIRSLCSRAIWLDAGRVRLQGPADDVIDAYREAGNG
jgi:homopolymeric O-antigen transport system ATP-binding protein